MVELVTVKVKKVDPNFHEKLTKEELIHLMRDANVTDHKGLERTLLGQARDRLMFPSIEPCWDCRMIAHKLNFEV